MDSLARVRTMKSTLRVCQIPSAFVQDDEYVLNDDDESEKEDEYKGYAENEKEFKILINSDSPIEIE